MKKADVFALVLMILLGVQLQAQKRGKTIKLLDADLSYFEKWNGVPHTSVEGLPEGTYQSDNVHKGTPLRTLFAQQVRQL